MTLSRDMLILAAILLLALVLRVVGLNAPLWYDEIITVDTHLRLPWGQMMRDYSMNHHYLHNLLAKASVSVFGERIWAIRLPAMLFGLASIAALWVLARDLAGARIAHVAALLLTLSFHHIWFSQNARGYTGLAFFSTVAMILFLRGLKAPTAGRWIGFGLMLTAAVFTHLTGAFFFAALGLVWLGALVLHGLRHDTPAGLIRLPLIGAAAGLGLTVLLYLPIIPGMLAAVSTVADTSAVDVMQEYQSPLWSAGEAIRTAMGDAGMLNVLLGAAVLGLSLLGALRLRARPVFPLAVLVHIVLTIAVLMVLGMRVWPRFFFVDIGFLLILIVLGVAACCDAVARLIGGRKILFPLAVLAMALLSGLLALRNYSAPKQDLAGAFAMVEAQRVPGERVYAVGYAGDAFRGHFGADWTTIFEDGEYQAAMAQPGPVTFVVAFPGRNFRRMPLLDGDRAKVLTERAWLPGTLGDGGVVILHRD